MDGLLRTSGPSSRYVCRRCTRQIGRSSRRLYASASKPDIYDVVCVGGGPAGLSLLTALRKLNNKQRGHVLGRTTPILIKCAHTYVGANPITSGLRIALIEAQDLTSTRQWDLPSNRFSNRCSSLTPVSANYFKTIGAWKHMKQERIQPYHEMQVWDGVSDARVEFDWGGGPGQTIAHMIENLNITSGLLRRLGELGGVAVFDKAKVEGIEFGEDKDGANLSQWPVVQLANGQRLWARLLVGADGANSPVRSFAGIESRGWDYGRHGVVATLQLEGEGWGGDRSKVAYQRFLPTGPIAVLPLPGNYSSLVWTTTPDRASVLKSLSTKDFAAMVNAAFRLGPADLEYLHTQSAGQEDEVSWRMKHVPFVPEAVPQTVTGVQEGTVASFPLKLRHADTYIGERVALVGDAAHTIHPLAGQGLNQGQGDIQSLAKTIEYAVSHGQDIGTQLSLESYNSERYAANHVVMGVCDKIHKLYSVGGGPLVPLRSLGLNAVNAMRPVKDFFMNQAAGNGFKLF